MHITDPRVPYARLQAAEDRARERFPAAKHVKALWTPANEPDITVEIHGDDGHAKVGVIA